MLLFYETGYSTYTLRQASRRSWRIGQKRPIRVGFLTYSETAQESCLRLMGKKLMASLPMEGKLHADGLQSMDADDDLLTAMARDLVTRQGVGEAAADVWKNLVGRHRGTVEVLDTALPAAVETTIAIQETDPVELARWIGPAGPAVQLSLF